MREAQNSLYYVAFKLSDPVSSCSLCCVCPGVFSGPCLALVQWKSSAVKAAEGGCSSLPWHYREIIEVFHYVIDVGRVAKTLSPDRFL